MVLTVLSGVTVFVIGQMVVALFIERIRIQLRTIERVAEILVIYSRDYAVPRPEVLDEQTQKRYSQASDEFRRLAALLRATTQTIKRYPLFQALRLASPRPNIVTASRCLIGLSNCVGGNEITAKQALALRQELDDALGFGDVDDDSLQARMK